MIILLERNNVIFLTLFLLRFLYSQVNMDYFFTKQLIAENKHSRALYYLNHFKQVFSEDTLNFLKGYNYYLLKKPDSASYFLKKISNSFPSIDKARFLSSINLSYTNEILSSIEILNNVKNDSDIIIQQVKNSLLAGNHLILRNLKTFDSISKTFDYNHVIYKKCQENLVYLKNNIVSRKDKSAVVAGILSFFFPGAGKFYAGRRGESLSAFLLNISLAAMAAESYLRTKSLTSPHFIVFSALFSFFYSGNIIGSIHAAKRQNKSFKKQINNEILANMHISVANLLE